VLEFVFSSALSIERRRSESPARSPIAMPFNSVVRKLSFVEIGEDVESR